MQAGIYVYKTGAVVIALSMLVRVVVVLVFISKYLYT